jgi:uncharacterized protein (UPF0332 family)
MFDKRQESDYKELAEPSPDEAAASVELAEEFLEGIKKII